MNASVKKEQVGTFTGQGMAASYALQSLKGFYKSPLVTSVAEPVQSSKGGARAAPDSCFTLASVKEEGAKKKEKVELSEVLKKAANRAIGGGVAGAAAMAINVSTLM